MFTFLHAADVHLDSPLLGLARYESAPVESLRGATRRAFSAMVDLAIEREVAFVLLAGDLYDGAWRDYNTGLFFSKEAGRLGDAGIPVVMVAGNHDAASRITRALHPPANVKQMDTSAPETWILEEPGVAVHGQGFATAEVTGNLALGYPKAVPGLFNIGLLHTALSGRPGHAPYAPCSVDNLRARGYQYWALGHVHAAEVVATDPHVVFPGCLQGRHARETGPKGCILVTVDGDHVTHLEHVPVDVIRWAAVEVDLEDAATADELLSRVRTVVDREVAGCGGRPLALRVTLVGSCPLNAELRADPERWMQEVRAVVATADEVWIEKVLVRTRGKRPLVEVVGEDETLGPVIARIAGAQGGAAELPGLAEVVAELRAKLVELEPLRLGLDLASTDDLDALVAEARELVLSRLRATAEAE